MSWRTAFGSSDLVSFRGFRKQSPTILTWQRIRNIRPPRQSKKSTRPVLPNWKTSSRVLKSLMSVSSPRYHQIRGHGDSDRRGYRPEEGMADRWRAGSRRAQGQDFGDFTDGPRADWQDQGLHRRG